MALLRTLLMLCGALAVLTLGALPAAAAGPAAPPCHEAPARARSGSVHHGEAPSGAPAKAIKVMACCVMCVTAPLPAPVEAARAAAAPDLSPLPVARLIGQAPTPEHGPPRA
ncbi:hypothetical protein [Brevundimonas sp. FT23028]|uniref:hypothetical protein n=1 Tax=Brevundimonas sp. FT23028 TaxID=3393748 RepID=UPI003B5864C1